MRNLTTLTTETAAVLADLDSGRIPDLGWIAGDVAYLPGDVQVALWAIEGVHVTDMLAHQHVGTWGVKIEREDCDSWIEIVCDEPEQLVHVRGRSASGDLIASASARWEI